MRESLRENERKSESDQERLRWKYMYNKDEQHGIKFPSGFIFSVSSEIAGPAWSSQVLWSSVNTTSFTVCQGSEWGKLTITLYLPCNLDITCMFQRRKVEWEREKLNFMCPSNGSDNFRRDSRICCCVLYISACVRIYVSLHKGCYYGGGENWETQGMYIFENIIHNIELPQVVCSLVVIPCLALGGSCTSTALKHVGWEWRN